MENLGDLTRRQFLKVSAILFGSAILDPKGTLNALSSSLKKQSEIPKEKISWTQIHFFENIEDFDPQKILPEAAIELQAFPEIFQAQLREIDFDKKEWDESIPIALTTLGKLKQLYETVKTAGKLDETASRLITQDFYYLGSKVWALLRVKELFESQPEKFGQILKKPYISKEEIPPDPFIGDEIYTIHSASWANKVYQPTEYDISSPLYYFIKSPIDLAYSSW